MAHTTKSKGTAIIRKEWQLKEIGDSIAETDAGIFVTDEEIESAFDYLRTGIAPPPIAK